MDARTIFSKVIVREKHCHVVLQMNRMIASLSMYVTGQLRNVNRFTRTIGTRNTYRFKYFSISYSVF